MRNDRQTRVACTTNACSPGDLVRLEGLRKRKACSPRRVPNDRSTNANEAPAMQLWKDFLTSDVGLMSAVVLGVILVMGGYYARFFIKHMQDDEKRAQGGQG